MSIGMMRLETGTRQGRIVHIDQNIDRVIVTLDVAILEKEGAPSSYSIKKYFTE